jgi:hypothetical protein
VIKIKKLSQNSIPDEVLDFTLAEMQKIFSGEIIFVAQDGYLMQVEINSKRRISDWEEKVPEWSEDLISNVKKQIFLEFSKLMYGRLVIKIQRCRVTQIERTVQQRFTGLDGEGI